VSTHPSRLGEPHPKPDPNANHRGALRAVPDPDTDEFAQLIAELAAEQHEPVDEAASVSWELRSDEEALLALGLPVATSAGDELPDLVDEDTDVHQAAVINIQTAQLHRYLREMNALDSKAIRLVWGIGCRPHTQLQAAQRTGRSREAVCRSLKRGMRELRVRFGVGLPDAS
jgi:hypothetical protein